MITMFTKQKYLSLRLDNNLSSRQASRLCGISRTTGDKYWKQYQEDMKRLEEATDPIEDSAISLETIVAPSYDSSSRKNRVFTEGVDEMVTRLLKDEEYKSQVLGRRYKRALTAVQIHELVTAAGYNISLSTITKTAKQKRKRVNYYYFQSDIRSMDGSV